MKAASRPGTALQQQGTVVASWRRRWRSLSSERELPGAEGPARTRVKEGLRA